MLTPAECNASDENDSQAFIYRSASSRKFWKTPEEANSHLTEEAQFIVNKYLSHQCYHVEASQKAREGNTDPILRLRLTEKLASGSWIPHSNPGHLMPNAGIFSAL